MKDTTNTHPMYIALNHAVDLDTHHVFAEKFFERFPDWYDYTPNVKEIGEFGKTTEWEKDTGQSWKLTGPRATIISCMMMFTRAFTRNKERNSFKYV